MKLTLVGTSHKLAPIEVREQVALDNINFVSNDQLRATLDDTTATPAQVAEAVRINTDARLRALRTTFMILAAIVTPWTKLSLHAAFAALTTTTLSLLGSRVGYVLVATLPLIWWSRIALARHRPRELALGLMLGALAGIALVKL